jgi:hypothetical protein
MNYPLSITQTAELVEKWGVGYSCYPPRRIQKLWAEIPPEVDGIDQLVEPVIRWLSAADSCDVIVLSGDAAAIEVIKNKLSDKIILTPVIITGGGTFRHVKFRKL